MLKKLWLILYAGNLGPVALAVDAGHALRTPASS